MNVIIMKDYLLCDAPKQNKKPKQSNLTIIAE